MSYTVFIFLQGSLAETSHEINPCFLPHTELFRLLGLTVCVLSPHVCFGVREDKECDPFIFVFRKQLSTGQGFNKCWMGPCIFCHIPFGTQKVCRTHTVHNGASDPW